MTECTDGPDLSIAELAARDPDTYDDPYDGTDRGSLPEWWRSAIESFEAHDLRPYRPPRFSDGELKHEVVTGLEAELNVELRIVGDDTSYGEPWTVMADGRPALTIPRRRTSAGYTLYEIESETFEKLVRESVEDEKVPRHD